MFIPSQPIRQMQLNHFHLEVLCFVETGEVAAVFRVQYCLIKIKV